MPWRSQPLHEAPALISSPLGSRQSNPPQTEKTKSGSCGDPPPVASKLDLAIVNLISELRNESRGFRGRTEDGGRHILCNPAASIERKEEETLAALAANPPTHLQPAAPETTQRNP
ncbi:hypothetical protein NDU88_006034 [Pleurodeles waltl]|uniref:Uncharacterized protein n=1 Tax=Pleurodeles waltl TaxID=8319 RepID=A0AAV7N616_PLEWA|nr:hypothetical protein NDU88_006034 [Pleurodeles waltl]